MHMVVFLYYDNFLKTRGEICNISACLQCCNLIAINYDIYHVSLLLMHNPS